MKNIIVIILIVFLFSCKATKLIEVPLTTKEVITERLVPVINPIDSLNLYLLFKCDSNRQVIMTQFNEEKTNRLKSQFSFSNGKLDYSVKTIHDTVYIKAKDITITKDVPYKVEVPVEVNKLTGFQWFQIYIGRIFITLLLLGGVYEGLKLKKII